MDQKTRAILSVFDKTDLIDLAKCLANEANCELIASGGTSKLLRDNGLSVGDVSDITQYPEMLGGRVKTLHPVVHGGILARDTVEHRTEMNSKDIPLIQYVVCNLYPFEDVIAKGVQVDEAIENIDIGGVTLLRAAAKNHERVVVLSDPQDYPAIISEITENKQISSETRKKLSVKAFELTAKYDNAIASYFRQSYAVNEKVIPLRYGMNPPQCPASISVSGQNLPVKVLNGSPGFINFLDALNGYQLVREIDRALALPAATSFKHVSPAGAAVGIPFDSTYAQVYMCEKLFEEGMTPLAYAYARARGADRMSSFGDFISLSRTVDVCTAKLIKLDVSDGIIAPGYEPEALELLKAKKAGKFSVLQIDPTYEPNNEELRTVFGLQMKQMRNNQSVTAEMFKSPITQGNKAVTDDIIRDIIIGHIVMKYTQSNSVVYCHDGQVVGIGAGQQSRIHCVRLAGDKANQWWLRFNPRVLGLKFKAGVNRANKTNAIENFVSGEIYDMAAWLDHFEENVTPFTTVERKEWISKMPGLCLISDAFFPFRDSIDRAVQSGARYIAHPGGSAGDANVIEACKSNDVTLFHTGTRLFHH